VTDLTSSSGFYKILSCACFALINLLLKKINLPASQITCLESLLGAAILWTIPVSTSLNWTSNSTIGQNGSPWKNPLYLVRAVLALIGSWLWVISVQKLPLLQSVAMGFLSPFVTLLGAWFFLGESLTFWRILAIVLAFAGGTMISFGDQIHRAYANVFDPWVLTPLLATALFSIINLISKSLLSTTSPLVLTRSLMLITGMGMLATCSEWVMPSRLQMGTLILLGILAASAHISSHLAMARSDVIALLPLGVIRLILTGLLGWFFLKEVPSLWLICGIICSIAASFCLSWRFKK
jgi:drug/metabolite transporter (DMT)-like permease